MFFNFFQLLKGRVLIIQNIQSDNNEFFAKYDNTYLEQYDDMFMLMYVYLQRHRSIEGYVNLTVKDFLLYYNYNPNRSKGRINDKTYSILEFMISKEFIRYIGCYSNGGVNTLDGVDCDDMFTVQIINADEKWNPVNGFTKILYMEIDKLRYGSIKFMGKVLSLYINIKKYISGDENSTTANMFAFPSEDTLARECGFGISSVKTYTNVLCGLKMLYVQNYGSYKRMKKGKEVITNANNVYALNKKYLNDNTKEWFKEYLINNMGFIDGFYPFCDNLPNNNESEIAFDSPDGESKQMENNYTDVEILDMPTMSELHITNDLEKQKYIDDLEVQRYAEKLIKENGNGYAQSLFVLELMEKYPELDNYDKYWRNAKMIS